MKKGLADKVLKGAISIIPWSLLSKKANNLLGEDKNKYGAVSFLSSIFGTTAIVVYTWSSLCYGSPILSEEWEAKVDSVLNQKRVENNF